MEPPPKKSIVKGTVKMQLNRQKTNLVGKCPGCQRELAAYVDGEGNHRNLVACGNCKEIYNVELVESTGGEAQVTLPRMFATHYIITSAEEPDWSKFFATVREYLFDNIGEILDQEWGFVCRPDETHKEFPEVIINTKNNGICFKVTGFQTERDAGATINQSCAEFGSKFKADLHPHFFEILGFDANKNPVLIERRPLGQMDSEKKTGRA
ncbi:MAG: hypothetical protein AAB730_00470 [Patescibacteria group bacterium]